MVTIDSNHYCFSCKYANYGVEREHLDKTTEFLLCSKYSVNESESPESLRWCIEQCIQDKQRYLLLNISRKIAKLDANYEQPK